MRRLIRVAALLGGLCIVIASGCKSDESTAQSGPPVEMAEVEFDAIEAVLKESKGKVVLIDVWATWCGPCRSTFPEFVNLHKKFVDRGLVCMSVSIDMLDPRPEYKPERVMEFLKSKKAAFRNFVLKSDKKDELSSRLGLGGGIPYKVMFDKKGNRIDISDMEEHELIARIATELAKTAD